MGDAGRTKGGDDAAAPGEGGPRADVALGERVPHGGEEQANAAVDGGATEAGLDGILGMVVAVVAGRRRHGAGCWRVRWREMAGRGDRVDC